MLDIRFVVKIDGDGDGGDDIGNVLKCFITGLSVNPNTQIECNPDYIFGNYDTILDKKHIFRQDEKNGNKIRNEYIYINRLLVLTEEEPYQSHICDNNQEYNGISTMTFPYSPIFIDYNYDSERICEKVKNRFFHVIQTIQFSMLVVDRVYRNTILMVSSGKRLGISIQTNGIDRPYNFETYANKIMEVLTMHSDIQTIVLSFDNCDVEKQYLDLINQFKKVVVLRKEPDDICMNPLQYSMIKMLTLSKCEYFICNGISNFSDLVFWFSRCRIKTFII